jgi:hypothetical protein
VDARWTPDLASTNWWTPGGRQVSSVTSLASGCAPARNRPFQPPQRLETCLLYSRISLRIFSIHAIFSLRRFVAKRRGRVCWRSNTASALGNGASERKNSVNRKDAQRNSTIYVNTFRASAEAEKACFGPAPAPALASAPAKLSS